MTTSINNDYFMLDDIRICREDITQILLGPHGDDVITALISSGADHYAQAGAMINDCYVIFDLVPFQTFSLFSFAKYIANLAFSQFLWSSALQMQDVLNDPAAAAFEYERFQRLGGFNKSFEEWFSSVQSVSQHINVPTVSFISIIQVLVLFHRFLYKSPEFHQLFADKMADYIIQQFHLNNLSPEFLNLLISYYC
jgi:hypothetical protein